MPEAAIHEVLSDKHAPGDLVVVKFRGTEAVNRLYRFDVLVRCSAAVSADLERTLAGQRADLAIGGQTPRSVRGVVSEVGVAGTIEGGDERVRKLRIVPQIWFLRHTQKSRIFQDKSVPAIVASVLQTANIAHRMELSGRYLPRVNCVQYQESDLAFVERLLAEEGIFYWFEHGEGASEVLVMADAPELIPMIDGNATLIHRERGGESEDDLLGFQVSTRVRTGRVQVRHWDFLRPGHRHPGVAEERASDIDLDERTMEIYEHQGDLDEFDASDAAARLRLEQARARRRVASGESRCRRLVPGRVFQLQSTLLPEAEGQFTIVRVVHTGVHPEGARGVGVTEVYKNEMQAIPAKTAPRPRKRPRRVQQTMETATVVGPAGKEIHTDEHGRIRVRFHWDREGRGDDASCWMRTMQTWSGVGWGTQFIPRVGMEVVVLFVGGDVDRPLVIGCVPNVTQPMPFPLPRNKTKSGIKSQSTPGGGAGHNELSFEDRIGFEQIHIHAERDMNVEVNRDLLERVGRNSTEQVGQNSFSVVAQNRLESVGGNRTDVVSGDRTMSTEGDVSTRIEGSERHVVTGNVAFRVAEDLNTSIGGSHEHRVAGDVQLHSTDVLVRAASSIIAQAGTAEHPGLISAHAEGGVSVSASKEVQVLAGGEVFLTCGTSSILIGPSSIQIASDSIVLSGGGASLHLADDKAILLASSVACIKSDDKVSLFSSSGSVAMSSDVKIGGSSVKLGSAASPDADPTVESKEPTTIELVDTDGDPIANERFKVYLSDGRILGGVTDGEGKAQLRFDGDAEIVFPDLGGVESD